MNNQFLETFLNEWNLYQKQGGTPTVDKGRSAKSADDFDKPVHAGEIRVFADSDRQLIGLVYKSWGEDAWVIIPASEFSVPATEQEILIGSRVYQLWNAFTASTAFAGKSWLIDTLALDDQQDISAALLHVTIGEPLGEDLAECLGEKISSVDDPRLEYERQFVANEGLWADIGKVSVVLREITPIFDMDEYQIAASDVCGNVVHDFKIEHFEGFVRIELSRNERCVYVRVYDDQGELSKSLDGLKLVRGNGDEIGTIVNCSTRIPLWEGFDGKLALLSDGNKLLNLRKVK